VIDPELLVDGNTFKERISRLTNQLKAARKLPSIDEIMIPGERGDAFMQAVIQAGALDIEDQLWQALQATAN
jgi:LDH2 family malate/lactate/ureidoglycolate dehydrogenase